MDRHFQCTACGKCCHGLLPLLLEEAIEFSDQFPLAMVWTVPSGPARTAALTARLGTAITVGRRKVIAVEIAAMAYLPETLPCPKLTEDGLCSIHDHKPQRCRTMPFYAYRDEGAQDSFLLPRPGWKCDVSRQAPLVYQGQRIVPREAFEQERSRLEQQAETLKAYADRLLKSSAALVRDLEVLAQRPAGGRLALSFTGILPRVVGADIQDFARRQIPVLRHYATLTAGHASLKTFHGYYETALRGLEAVAR